MKTLAQVSLELFIENGAKAVERNDIAIVIDVFRCSSTIIAALANGIKEVIPVETLEEAFTLHAKKQDFILAGERAGLKPNRFDLGNSPLAFISGNYKGKKLILTTSNGTKAIKQVDKCSWVLIGAFLNAGVVASIALKLASKNKTGITILLASNTRSLYLEDFICGGLLSSKFKSSDAKLDDSALSAMLSWKKAEEKLREVIKNSQHGKYLMDIGYEKDVDFCSNLDVYPIIPYLKNGSIKKLE